VRGAGFQESAVSQAGDLQWTGVWQVAARRSSSAQAQAQDAGHSQFELQPSSKQQAPASGKQVRGARSLELRGLRANAGAVGPRPGGGGRAPAPAALERRKRETRNELLLAANKQQGARRQRQRQPAEGPVEGSEDLLATS
jgi:hypothetical protein